MKALQLSSPHIIAMVGVPGAGKTQFATEFAEMFGAPRLDCEVLTELSDNETKVNLASGAILKELMKTRQTIIFEGATEKRAWRGELARAARAAGYKVLLVWVQTDLPTAKARWMKARGGDEALFEQKLKQFSAPHPSESCVVISGRHTYNTQARTLLKKLSEGARPATPATHTTAAPLERERPQPRPSRIRIG